MGLFALQHILSGIRWHVSHAGEAPFFGVQRADNIESRIVRFLCGAAVLMLVQVSSLGSRVRRFASFTLFLILHTPHRFLSHTDTPCLIPYVVSYPLRRFLPLTPFLIPYTSYYLLHRLLFHTPFLILYAVFFPVRRFLSPYAEAGVSSFSRIVHETGVLRSERYSERS